MRNDVALPQLFFDQLRNKILPELLSAGEESLAAFEQGRTPDGTYNFTNYTLGCAFWDNSFTRLKRTCVGEKSFFGHTVHYNVLEVHATIDTELISFFITRVHPDSRIPRSGMGIKRLLHSPIIQNQEFLSKEIQVTFQRFGAFTIGVDLDAENGIGKITFDRLLPAKNKRCYALTCETLYDATVSGMATVMPEIVPNATVTRTPSTDLAKPDRSGMMPAPEQLKRNQLKRNQQDSKPATKAKK